MDTELEKLVEAGKLTPRAAQQLEKLKPGTFCLHKSWGFGRVVEWNLLLNQIVIDFAGKKSHSMQAPYAAENLTSLSPEHFLVRKANDLVSIKKLATEDPVAVVRNTDELIASFNKARQPKEQIAALEQIIKFYQQFKGSEKQLQLIVTSIENVAARNQKMHPELAFELIIARDDLLERVPLLR